MPLIADITPRPKVLHVLLSGEFSLDAATQNFLQIIALIEEHHSEMVLVDGRRITGDPEVIERFSYAEFAADAVRKLRERSEFSNNPQFAYVLHEPVLDPLRFGETVALNRGMSIKVFNNPDEAMEWLDLTPQDLTDS